MSFQFASDCELRDAWNVFNKAVLERKTTDLICWSQSRLFTNYWAGPLLFDWPFAQMSGISRPIAAFTKLSWLVAVALLVYPIQMSCGCPVPTWGPRCCSKSKKAILPPAGSPSCANCCCCCSHSPKRSSNLAQFHSPSSSQSTVAFNQTDNFPIGRLSVVFATFSHDTSKHFTLTRNL